jgi:hypothetical protein
VARGDHVYAPRLRGLYSHHAIDCGDGSVIHYTGPSQLDSRVARTAWDEFAGGSEVRVRSYAPFLAALARRRDPVTAWSLDLRRALDRLRGVAIETLDFSPDAVVARAVSRLGERRFDLVLNNCEHFASWCKTGISESRQVEAVWRAALAPWDYRRLRVEDALTHWLDPWVGGGAPARIVEEDA